MENYVIGAKFKKNEVNYDLVNWLNATQHYLEDIIEGEFVYRITKSPELPDELVLDNLRNLREKDCFSVINRGQFWYDTLDLYQKEQLKSWYISWLDVTVTHVIPIKPEWLR